MAKQGTKKKSDRLLRTAVFLGIFFGACFLPCRTGIAAGAETAPRSSETAPPTVRALPEPEIAPPGPEAVGRAARSPRFDNLLYGIPGAADTIVEREGYALGYMEKHEQPAWVQYVMTAGEVSRRAAKRKGNFRPDPEIPTGSATPRDYDRSGYDRGHLAPAADMAFSARTMAESFYMSNISPQLPEFNRGIWSKLERQVRRFAVREKRIVVVTGPVLPAEKSVTIGVNQVTVPRYYYKVIYDTTPPEKMIAFVLPNRGSSADLRTFAVTVDQVEELTGLDFFSSVPRPKQEQLERSISPESWDWLK